VSDDARLPSHITGDTISLLLITASWDRARDALGRKLIG
jgi:hypothetical protein